jgi:mevalonate pyrophosphate decarboxylase
MRIATAALILLAWSSGGCSRADRNARSSDDHSIAKQMGRAAYRLSQETKKAASKAAQELSKAGKEAHQGWNEAKRESRKNSNAK